MRILHTVTAIVVGLSFVTNAGGVEGSQPNILFIFSDDQAPGTIGAYGNKVIKTPNLDRLAAEGVRFDHAYNQGSFAAAVCVASRTMLNTGESVWNAAKFTSQRDFQIGGPNMPRVGPVYRIESGEPKGYWSEYLKRAGYETYLSGKWHVAEKPEKIFDHTTHVRGGMPNQTNQAYNRSFIEVEKDIWSPYDKTLGGFWLGGKHWSEVLADDGVEFLSQAAKKDNPFFMYLAFNAPHDPRQAPKEYVDMYPTDQIDVPENFLPEYPYAEYAGAGHTLRDERLLPYPRTPYAVKKNRQEYFALVSHMDSQIGRILDALKASGKADNTYIIFTSDHGLAIGEHGFVGKQNMYESSIQVPLLIAGPGLTAGKTVDALVYLQDIMPTTLELAGAEKPGHVAFHSLMPLATGETDRSRYDAIYGCYFSVQRMVRTDTHKMIVYPAANRVRLYDIKSDPMEMNDLADNKDQNKALLMKMLAELKKLQKELGDAIDVTQAFNNFMNGVAPEPLPPITLDSPTS